MATFVRIGRQADEITDYLNLDAIARVYDEGERGVTVVFGPRDYTETYTGKKADDLRVILHGCVAWNLMPEVVR